MVMRVMIRFLVAPETIRLTAVLATMPLMAVSAMTTGGAGDDTYTVDSGDDTIVVGGGTDSLVMGGRMTGAIRTDEDGDGNFDLELTGVSDGEVYTATVLDQTNDGLTNVEIDLSDDGVDNPTSYVIDDTLVIGSDEADTLTSGDEGGVFFGNAGDDLMTGGDGATSLRATLATTRLKVRAAMTLSTAATALTKRCSSMVRQRRRQLPR